MIAKHRQPWNRLQAFARSASVAVGRPDRSEHGLAASDALDAVRCARELRHVVEEWEVLAVKGARMAEVPWAEIALAAGVSRQAAWERWHELTAPVEALA